MTVAEIRELANIKYPETVYPKDYYTEPEEDLSKYVEEHKVNDKFIIVTGPIGSGKLPQYMAMADGMYPNFDDNNGFFYGYFCDNDELGLRLFGRIKNFVSYMKNGGTVLIDDLDCLSDTTIEQLIQMTSNDTFIIEDKLQDEQITIERKEEVKIHPDFRLIGVITPAPWKNNSRK